MINAHLELILWGQGFHESVMTCWENTLVKFLTAYLCITPNQTKRGVLIVSTNNREQVESTDRLMDAFNQQWNNPVSVWPTITYQVNFKIAFKLITYRYKLMFIQLILSLKRKSWQLLANYISYTKFAFADFY